MTVLRSGSASDVGRVRSVNEDRVLDSLPLFAVADGMGGHAGGEVASRLAVDTLENGFTREPSAAGLVAAVQNANHAVFEQSRQDPDLRGMGTTLTAAALVSTPDGDRFVLVNVGDSRAYRFGGDGLVQLTDDHSVAEELVARGELSEAEAAVHPHRHILTRALGVAPEVDVDAWELEPHQGQRYLLCSDGLSNEVSPDRIENVLASTNDPQRAAETLVRMANEHGGNDNVTVLLVDVVSDGGPGEAAPADGGETSNAVSPADSSVALASGSAGRADSGAGTEAAGEPANRAPGAAVAFQTGSVSAADRQVRDGASSEASLANATMSGSPPGSTVDGQLRQAGHLDGAEDFFGSAAPSGLSTAERPADSGRKRRSRSGDHKAPRRVTFRSILFVLLVAGIGYGAYALVEWYSQNSYFVKADNGELVVYRGRPGGFLWTHPKPVKWTGVEIADVPSQYWGDLRSGVEESSYENAVQYVSRLQQYEASLQGSGSSPPTSTPTSAPTHPDIPSTTAKTAQRAVGTGLSAGPTGEPDSGAGVT